MTGHVGKHASLKRYIPVHDIYQQFSAEQHRIMLSIYCITGCDTTSAFYGHGKITAFKLMMQQTAKFQALATLGTALLIYQHEKVASIRFVSCMYGKDSEYIDTLRSSCDGAVVANPTRNHKVACSRPDAAMLSLGIGSLNHN